MVSFLLIRACLCLLKFQPRLLPGRIVQLRKEYNWLVEGTTDASVVIHITNESDSMLDCLTLGVRSKDHTLNGAVKVDVKGLAPGMSRTIQLDCYSDLIKPTEVEVFDLPDPTPARRSNYFELRQRSG